MNPIIQTISLLRKSPLTSALAACAVSGSAVAASTVSLSLVPSATVADPGDPLTVTVHMGVSTPAGEEPTTMYGAQIALHFDQSKLEPMYTQPSDVIKATAGAPFAALLIGPSAIDIANGTILFAAFDDDFDGTTASADLFTLHFRVKQDVSACSVPELFSFEPVGSDTTSLSTSGAQLIPALTNLPTVNLDHLAPNLTVSPTDITVATDAGSTTGAFIAAPTITKSDNCDDDLAVTLVAILPGVAPMTEWPSEFPIGTSTVTWTATDDAGNTATQVQTITVENHQLLDATIKLRGAVSADGSNSERPIRITTGASTQVVTVMFAPVIRSEDHVCQIGEATGVEIPVAAGYPCVSAKDAGHSLTATAGATDTGTKYETSILLLQGDSNDDDLVDIVDFGCFVLDLGLANPESRSNFNADGVVDRADFAHISINMLMSGQDCTSGFKPGEPRTKISVRELRRSGLGHLACADLDGDGWIDGRDVARFLAEGGPLRASEDRMDRRKR